MLSYFEVAEGSRNPVLSHRSIIVATQLSAQIFRYLFDIINKSIHNAVMSDLSEKYEDDPEFQEFLDAEFNETAVSATMDELAEFAFGSFDEAIKALENRKKN